MRLATAVEQTHGCYFLNKLSYLCYLVISTCYFSSINFLMRKPFRGKNINYFRKNSVCI